MTTSSKTTALNEAEAASQKVWQDVELALRYARRVLLWGPPGTGKSYAGLAGRKNAQRLYLTLDTPSAEIRGHYLPSESGGFVWHDGPATRAWRHGLPLIIDEIDAASGDTLTLLLGYLDDAESAGITLPNNESLSPKAGFCCVATTNQLPTSLPEALLDRFECVIHVPHPAPAALDPNNWVTPHLAEAARRQLYLGAVNTGRAGRPVRLRSFRAIDTLVRDGLQLEQASRLVLGDDVGQAFCSAIKLIADDIK